MAKKIFRNIAVSCKAKDLLDEIARVYEQRHQEMRFNKGVFVEGLIEKAHGEIVVKGE